MRSLSRARATTLAVLALLAVIVAAAGAAVLWRSTTTAAGDGPQSLQVILIKPGNYFAEEEQEAADAGGKVPPETLDLQADGAALPLADVRRNQAGAAFLGLLGNLHNLTTPIDQSVVFRVRDGVVINGSGGDALADNNAAVIVVPQAIVVLFDTPQAAFLQIRLRVSGLTQ
jgi:hypothetical protein